MRRCLDRDRVQPVDPGCCAEPQREGEEDDALKPLSERLISELTALKSPNAFHDLICPMRNLRALSIARENTSVALPI